MLLYDINNEYQSISFTYEVEQNNSLAFLDVAISRVNNQFSTSVFRKSTFSGLGISFFSHCCKKFKINAIHTLLHRAYANCSSYQLMHTEFEFLTNFFSNNGFPKSLVQTMINRFLNHKLTKSSPVLTVRKKTLYFVLPYFGHTSVQMKISLCNLIGEYFPQIDPQIILVNKFKIGSFFNHKDSLPNALRSNLVYMYCCAKCASEYYGSTVRSLHTRICEHKGLSHRTGRPLLRPPQSSIRDHALSCSSDISIDNFKIIASESDQLSLRILESIFIFTEKPVLNDLSSAYSLKLYPT